MRSLRDVARRSLGLTGGFSVNRDVYGYIYRAADGTMFGPLTAADILPFTGQRTMRSLQRHVQTIAGPAFDMVPIFVGFRPGFTGTFTRAQAVRTQYAIQIARDLYAQQGLGIRRIVWQAIPEDDVGLYTDIADRAEAKNLADDWSGPPGGIDVFLVQAIGDADGWSHSPPGGPCDKNADDDLTGPVLEVPTSALFARMLLAHEVGHYLGLAGGVGAGNLMGADVNMDGIDELSSTSTALTNDQGTTIRSHCSVSTSVA